MKSSWRAYEYTNKKKTSSSVFPKLHVSHNETVAFGPQHEA
jgi:hypothetical protein